MTEIVYDITRPISAELAVWPGDSPFAQTWTARIDGGDVVNLSTLAFSAHIGTHVDAPLHFVRDGRAIGDVPLSVYCGPATVIHLPFTGPIFPDHMADLELTQIQRLLIRTPSSDRDDHVWSDDITYLSPDAAHYLAQHGVLLFGTDAPSVDPIASTTLAAHHALHEGGVAILENAYLREAPSGSYELIALPLRVPADGSPVRAILRSARESS